MMSAMFGRCSAAIALVLIVPLVGSCACSDEDDSARTASLAARDDQGDRAAIDQWRQPQRLVAELRLSPGDRVADVGAGRGYLEPYLAAAVGPDGRIVATDIDAAALAALARAARRDGIAVDTRVVGPGDPGLEPGSYDLVLLAMVDHLLPDRADYVRRLVGALAPGGRIAVVNRIDREAAVRAGAESAGLETVGVVHDLPGQFVLLLAPRAADGGTP